LVHTAREIDIVVEELNERILDIPVMIGGVAATRRKAEKLSENYAGEVYYGKDAMAALKICEEAI